MNAFSSHITYYNARVHFHAEEAQVVGSCARLVCCAVIVLRRVRLLHLEGMVRLLQTGAGFLQCKVGRVLVRAEGCGGLYSQQQQPRVNCNNT